MKRYLVYIFTVLLLFIVLFQSIIFGILLSKPGTFHDNYNSLIVDKYRILQKTDEPKIIIVAGSSASFGLDQNMLEHAAGYKVVNLGLHAGFGHRFYTELAKENINAGDIVLLGYEYGWEDGFKLLSQEMIMTGVDEHIDLYKHIPADRWGDFIGYVFTYASLKNSYEGSSGIYSREAFDPETAQMTMHREYAMNYPENIDIYGTIDLTDVTISDETTEYLKDFKEYVQHKGASIYFIAPPLLKQAITCDYSEFDNLKKQEEEIIGIPYISDPKKYFFEDRLMSNTIYHCSSEGETVRTELLIQDLKNASIIQ